MRVPRPHLHVELLERDENYRIGYLMGLEAAAQLLHKEMITVYQNGAYGEFTRGVQHSAKRIDKVINLFLVSRKLNHPR